MASTEEKVSRNALYALAIFGGIFALTIGSFTHMVITIGFADIPGEVIAFFSGGIGVLGTIVGTLIQSLWGK